MYAKKVTLQKMVSLQILQKNSSDKEVIEEEYLVSRKDVTQKL